MFHFYWNNLKFIFKINKNNNKSVRITFVNKKQKIRFSVVIPCFNEEKYLDATLASLTAQNFKKNYEIIVVDNNCTDSTVDIANNYTVRIITENQPGVCWAREAGTQAANGEIVISTDADTTFDDNWLSNIDSQFERDTSLIAVCAPCEFVDAPFWGRIYPKILFNSVYFMYRIIGHPFYITATNTAFKKSAWDGYNTQQTQGGDELELLHNLRRKGKVAFTTDYVVHTSSRRLVHGLWYNVFVSFLYYYLLAYYINRIFKKPIIGAAPAYRKKGTSIVAFKNLAKEIKSRNPLYNRPTNDELLTEHNVIKAKVK